MKVLHLIAPGPVAGAEKVVLFGVEALGKLGMDVTLGIIDDERVADRNQTFLKIAQDLNLKTHLFPTAGKVDFSLIRRFRELQQRENFSVIHFHGYKPVIYGYYALHKQAALIVTSHGFTAHTFLVRCYEKLERFIYPNLDAVCVVSEAMFNQLSERGVNQSSLFHTPNMLTIQPDLDACHKEEDGEKNSLKLVYIGRLSSEKGVNFLIKAMSQLKDLPLSLTIVGDGVERENLANLVRALGLQDVIHFAGYQTDVRSFLKENHCVVLPSLREGLPLILLEAAAYGKPIVASNVGGVPKVVADGVNGLLTEAGSVESLSEKIKDLWQNRESFEVESKKLAPEILKQYSSESWGQQILTIYQQIITDRNS